MIEGGEVIRGLIDEGEAGASRDHLLREAVLQIQAAEEHYDWVGIYLLEGDVLILHNYIGKATDHTRIPVGQGVCGTAVAEARDINVPDVHAISNYLACSLETVSELVVLMRDPESGEIFGQLDLDSDRRDAFTERDELELKVIADWLAGLFGSGSA